MNIYLVDFENVNSQGLNGINRLSENDRIIIFYSENADSMTFELHEQINQSRADIFFQKVDVGLKNALDFQLATYLGYLICGNEAEKISADYYVVTKDRGYASLITYWTKRKVDISLVGSLIQSMRIQKEKSDEKRRAMESAAREARGAEKKPVSAVPDEPQQPDAVSAEEESARSGQPAPDGDSAAEEPARAGQQPDAASAAEEPDTTQPTPVSAAAEEKEPVQPAADAVSAADEPQQPDGSEEGEELLCIPDTAEANADAADSGQEPQSEPAEETAAAKPDEEPPAVSDAGEPESEPEEKPRRTRSRRKPRSTADQSADQELRSRVEQAVPDKEVVDLVVSYIKKYKTKLGINNALAKEFKDSKKASEIYKSIKPLIADKKGQ